MLLVALKSVPVLAARFASPSLSLYDPVQLDLCDWS